MYKGIKMDGPEELFLISSFFVFARKQQKLDAHMNQHHSLGNEVIFEVFLNHSIF